MSKKYCLETRFNFLDPEEKTMIYKAMDEYCRQFNPKKTYISGKITGLELPEAEQNFHKAGLFLKKKYGCDIINPMFDVEYHPEKTWAEYMLEDIKLLFTCDSIYMLNNWKDSKGARIEFNIAVELGINLIFEVKPLT